MELNRQDSLKEFNSDVGDFFHNHDTKLNSELGRFYRITNDKRNDESLVNLRDSVVDASQEYKNSTIELKQFVTEEIGFEPVEAGDKDLTSAEVEELTVAKMLHSLDALMYKDMLENQGKGYEELMDRRDTFTNSQDIFNRVIDGMSDKSTELEILSRSEHDTGEKFGRLLEAIDRSGPEQIPQEIER